MKRYTDWYTFGWHGITVSLPTEWNLGKIGGDTRSGVSGYLRLDDAEIARVEIEWRASTLKERKGSTRRGGDAGISLSQFVDRYTDTLQKKAKAKGTPLSIQRQVNVIDTPEEHECFLWEADFRAYNFARYCSTCGRIVLLRVLTRLSEDASLIVPGIFASLTDHPVDDSPTYWGVYDLAFTLPPGLKLEEYALKSGHLFFRFEEGKATWRSGGRSLQIDRLSLGTLFLKRYPSLTEWFENYFHKALKDFRRSYDEKEMSGHTGLFLKGTPKAWWQRLFVPMPFISSRPRRYMSGRIWHCPESDKIFFVRALTKQEDYAADKVVTVVCHQKNSKTVQGGDARVAPDTKPSSCVGS